MVENRLSWLVTKNAGGADTEAKLIAARALGIPVIMVERPVKPQVKAFASAGLLAAEIRRLLSP
jgi:precorrin-6A/cobalt-precorrin-6A reductase